MISIMNYLNEADLNHSGYTKMDARRGYGKLLGTPVGGIPGTILGNYIADSTAHPKDKFTKIDEKSKADRVGSMYNEAYNAKRLSIGGGIGALIGAGLGAAATGGSEIGTGFGAATGAGIGSSIGGMKGSYNAAKRLGYGGFGRVAAATFPGPLVGLTTPKRIQDSKK